ncbi:DUF397 domain-containing protein [Streptomyces spinoverrucosus]
MRDSKDPLGRSIIFRADAWSSLIGALRHGALTEAGQPGPLPPPPR